MNYELAKELKDAGFLQNPLKAYSKSDIYIRHIKDNLWYQGDKEPLLKLRNLGKGEIKWPFLSFQKEWDWENYVYIPTLSELISACEVGLSILYHNSHEGRWEAGIADGEDGGPMYHQAYPYGFGSSPEEAVARLWLALNKK